MALRGTITTFISEEHGRTHILKTNHVSVQLNAGAFHNKTLDLGYTLKSVNAGGCKDVKNCQMNIFK
jgi:hypothetical protein